MIERLKIQYSNDITNQNRAMVNYHADRSEKDPVSDSSLPFQIKGDEHDHICKAADRLE